MLEVEYRNSTKILEPNYLFTEHQTIDLLIIYMKPSLSVGLIVLQTATIANFDPVKYE